LNVDLGLIERLGSTYIEVLQRHQVIVRRAFAAFGGVEHGTEGDSFFATFPTAADAVRAAVHVQLEHQRASWPSGGQLRARVGIHFGAVADTPAGMVGPPIHHGARIAASGHGGQVVAAMVWAPRRVADGTCRIASPSTRGSWKPLPPWPKQAVTTPQQPIWPPLRS
jgi:hypothetical protein